MFLRISNFEFSSNKSDRIPSYLKNLGGCTISKLIRTEKTFLKKMIFKIDEVHRKLSIISILCHQNKYYYHVCMIRFLIFSRKYNRKSCEQGRERGDGSSFKLKIFLVYFLFFHNMERITPCTIDLC